MLAFLFALLIGVIAGLRAMTAPAAVAWGARLGMIDVSGSWLSFFAHPAAVQWHCIKQKHGAQKSGRG